MDRRNFLKAASAAGITAAGAPFAQSLAATASGPPGQVSRVIVIGAGIVGASIAYNLSKRGCDVLMLEKVEPAAQASGNSFAWINASWSDQPDSYYTLRTHSLNEYHRLEEELDFPIRWGGSLEWYHTEEAEQEMSEGVDRIQALGAPTWMIDKDRVAHIEPKLKLMSDGRAAWCSRDGAVDAAAATRAMVDGVTDNGGRIIFPAVVSSIRQSMGGVEISAGMFSFKADLVVIAAGTGANEIASLAGLGINLVKPATPGIIVTTRPMPPLIKAVAYTTDTHFHQRPDGRVVIGEKAGAPDTGEHMAYLTDRPNAYPTAELAKQHADRVLQAAGEHLPPLAGAEVERIGVGWRPLPVDGLPIVGHVPTRPHVYIASMHSGVTLAPIIGHLAAMEILDGVRVNLLDDFRVERLLG
jgi:glycine/D-amino acid oxidase-like deaminating enzyme